MHKSSQPSHKELITFLIIGVIAASTGASFIRLSQSEGASSFVIAAARLLIASIIILPIIVVKYLPSIRKINLHDWVFSILAGFFLALHFAFWVTSLEFTPIASSVILVSTTPIWVALVEIVLFREPINKMLLLGLLCALFGILIISLGDECSWRTPALICPQLPIFFQSKNILGNSLALLGAWAASGYLLVGKNIRNRVPLLPYIFIVYSVGALLLITIAIINHATIIGLEPKAYFWFLLLAIIPQIIGHSIFNWTLKYLPTTFISISLLGEPIGSTFLAIFLFNEIPSWMKIPGFLLLLIGIWISGRYDSSKSMITK